MMIELTPGDVSLEQLRHWASSDAQFSLSADSYERIEASAHTVRTLCASDASVYGINTGFGKLANKKIDHEQLGQLQENLILSHCCGLGEPLDDEIVRTVLLLKLLSLARGYSGVTRETVDCLLALLNHQVYPVIPAKGSVGASGDLAPLAHMSAAMLGIGEVRYKGETQPSLDALASIGVAPLRLQAKEGLALINGTQVSTALAVQALFKTERLFAAALTVGALSVDAMKGSDAPFDHRIHQVRGHKTQIEVAAVFRRLLKGSGIRASHVQCNRVQDPYSLRCQPQVMGAVLSSMQHVANVLLVECNGVTDNPLVFTQEQEALSGGNFHAEPVALVADVLAVAIAEIGALSERRMANLVDSNQSGLPAFLVVDAGLNSGFMIAQVTAAALASENKSLAHPASVDSLPTSANQEDHVSMATFAARRLHEMIDNTAGVLGIELLGAVQGIEFHNETTSPLLLNYVEKLREQVSRYEQDRYMAVDLERARALVMSELFIDSSRQLLPSYE